MLASGLTRPRISERPYSCSHPRVSCPASPQQADLGRTSRRAGLFGVLLVLQGVLSARQGSALDLDSLTDSQKRQLSAPQILHCCRMVVH